jgi:hypothetical protein
VGEDVDDMVVREPWDKAAQKAHNYSALVMASFGPYEDQVKLGAPSLVPSYSHFYSSKASDKEVEMGCMRV